MCTQVTSVAARVCFGVCFGARRRSDAPRRAQELEADAVVMAVGIAGLQKIVASSAALSARAEFRAVANLGALDVLAGIDPLPCPT